MKFKMQGLGCLSVITKIRYHNFIFRETFTLSNFKISTKKEKSYATEQNLIIGTLQNQILGINLFNTVNFLKTC